MAAFVKGLDPFERETAERYGTAVYWYAKENGLRDMRQNGETDSLQLNIDGSIAEHRCAKYHNVYPNYQLDGPTHVDLVINGKTVDVKWTSNPSHNLAVRGNITPENAADYFMLMRGPAEGEMEYVGHISSKEFFEKSHVYHNQNTGLPYRVCFESDLHDGPIPDQDLCTC